MLKKFAKHVSNYSIGNLLVTISGFISFPIFTRIFTIEEYGVMNLISATLGLLLAFSKLGIQHSIVRFYGEARSSNTPNAIRIYLSTTLYGMSILSVAITIVWALISYLIPSSWWSDARVGGLLLLTSTLLLVRNIDSCLINFLRAEERSAQLSSYNVIKRYGVLALVLIVIFWVVKSLTSYFIATIAAETIAVTLLLWWMNKRHRYSMSHFDLSLFKRMLTFGIPMIAYELAGNLLNTGDRYVIEKLLGAGQVGIYSSAYNFCTYVQTVFLMSIGQAVLPMYVRSWEEKGQEETNRLIQKTVRFYLMLALPLIAGVAAIGKEALIVLASEKYAEGANIIPYVLGGMAVDSMISMVAVGLYIHKRTMVMATMMAFSAILNILLNLWLIPNMGINGAAIATLISYIALASGAMLISQRLMPIVFPWQSAAKFSILSLLMYFLIRDIAFESILATLAAQISSGVVIYSLLVFISDRESRSLLNMLFENIKK